MNKFEFSFSFNAPLPTSIETKKTVLMALNRNDMITTSLQKNHRVESSKKTQQQHFFGLTSIVDGGSASDKVDADGRRACVPLLSTASMPWSFMLLLLPLLSHPLRLFGTQYHKYMVGMENKAPNISCEPKQNHVITSKNIGLELFPSAFPQLMFLLHFARPTAKRVPSGRSFTKLPKNSLILSVPVPNANIKTAKIENLRINDNVLFSM